MKKIFIALPLLFLVLILAFSAPQKSMVGKWVIHYGQGQNINLDFRKDGTVSVAIPAEQFTVTGKYKLKDDILYLSDSTCGSNYWGKYKESFITDDSVYSTMVEDSCMPRKSAVDKATFIRVKM
jgi:hypothetical protein